MKNKIIQFFKKYKILGFIFIIILIIISIFWLRFIFLPISSNIACRIIGTPQDVVVVQINSQNKVIPHNSGAPDLVIGVSEITCKYKNKLYTFIYTGDSDFQYKNMMIGDTIRVRILNNTITTLHQGGFSWFLDIVGIVFIYLVSLFILSLFYTVLNKCFNFSLYHPKS